MNYTFEPTKSLTPNVELLNASSSNNNKIINNNDCPDGEISIFSVVDSNRELDAHASKQIHMKQHFKGRLNI